MVHANRSLETCVAKGFLTCVAGADEVALKGGNQAILFVLAVRTVKLGFTASVGNDGGFVSVVAPHPLAVSLAHVSYTGGMPYLTFSQLLSAKHLILVCLFWTL